MLYNLETHETEIETIPTVLDITLELDLIERNIQAMSKDCTGLERIRYLLAISQLCNGKELLLNSHKG